MVSVQMHGCQHKLVSGYISTVGGKQIQTKVFTVSCLCIHFQLGNQRDILYESCISCPPYLYHSGRRTELQLGGRSCAAFMHLFTPLGLELVGNQVKYQHKPSQKGCFQLDHIATAAGVLADSEKNPRVAANDL